MELNEVFTYLATILNILIFVGSIYYNILIVKEFFKKNNSKMKKKYQIIYFVILTFNIILLIGYTYAGPMYKTHILLDVGFSIGYFSIFPLTYSILKKIK